MLCCRLLCVILFSLFSSDWIVVKLQKWKKKKKNNNRLITIYCVPLLIVFGILWMINLVCHFFFFLLFPSPFSPFIVVFHSIIFMYIILIWTWSESNSNEKKEENKTENKGKKKEVTNRMKTVRENYPLWDTREKLELFNRFLPFILNNRICVKKCSCVIIPPSDTTHGRTK